MPPAVPRGQGPEAYRVCGLRGGQCASQGRPSPLIGPGSQRGCEAEHPGMGCILPRFRYTDWRPGGHNVLAMAAHCRAVLCHSRLFLGWASWLSCCLRLAFVEHREPQQLLSKRDKPRAPGLTQQFMAYSQPAIRGCAASQLCSVTQRRLQRHTDAPAAPQSSGSRPNCRPRQPACAPNRCRRLLSAQVTCLHYTSL
jgi:hypothetical protein